MAALPIELVAQTSSANWQPIDEIASVAEHHLISRAGGSDDELVTTVGFLDPRLKLPMCDEPLEAFMRPGTELSGRVVVGVRCTGSKAWKVYLPVHVGVMQKVVISSRSLPRGHVIAPGDIEVAKRDVSAIVGAYLSETGDLVGQRLTRSVTGGIVLAPPLLQDRTLISKGQMVTLNVAGESISISMSGIAVSDGVKNQIIKVRNAGSGKIVEGRVRSTALVEVGLN